MSAAETYIQHLDTIFQLEPLFYKNKSTLEDIPGVTSIIYEDVPEEGYITGLTYGLSSVGLPEWKFGRPELCISVASKNRAWGDVAGYIANEMRGEFLFSYGQIINFGERIAEDSEMSAFFIFAPSILEKQDYLDIQVGEDYKINIAGLYPIYEEEIEVFNKIGLEKFWYHPDFDMYNVNRPLIKG